MRPDWRVCELSRIPEREDAVKPGYYVFTWDAEKQEFNPQEGVEPGPYTQFGLRAALRALRHMGYDAGRGDCSILVEKEGT